MLFIFLKIRGKAHESIFLTMFLVLMYISESVPSGICMGLLAQPSALRLFNSGSGFDLSPILARAPAPARTFARSGSGADQNGAGASCSGSETFPFKLYS